MDGRTDFMLILIIAATLSALLLWRLIGSRARFQPRFGEEPLPPLSPPPTNHYGELEEP